MEEQKIYDFFLSHSQKDERDARALFKNLKNWGLDVYADFDDPGLSEMVDKALAERLREKLKRCRALLFAASENSASSRWVPWELGFAHGAIGRAYIYPLSKGAMDALQQQEYVKLYPVIPPAQARELLTAYADEAKQSVTSPAIEDATAMVAELFARQLPNLANPAVAQEILTHAPARVTTAASEGSVRGTLSSDTTCPSTKKTLNR